MKNIIITIGLISALGQIPVGAVDTLPFPQRKVGQETRRAFEPVREVIQKCSAVIEADSPRPIKDRRNKDRIGFATVVSEDGYLLAKASELKDQKGLLVTIDESTYPEVKILATDDKWDLALLKVEAKGLTPVRWASGEPEMASWVVSNGASDRWSRRVRIGIISANARAVKDGASRAVLGIVFEEKNLEVKSVTEKSGAKKAGVKEGDVIESIDGAEIKTLEDIQKQLTEASAGEVVKLGIKRLGQKLMLEVELKASRELYGEAPPSRNDGMSGRFSERRSDFPRILQHDIPFSQISTGGPLLNLKGECLGMNIARANRAETFAIPAKELKEQYELLLEKAKNAAP